MDINQYIKKSNELNGQIVELKSIVCCDSLKKINALSILVNSIEEVDFLRELHPEFIFEVKPKNLKT